MRYSAHLLAKARRCAQNPMRARGPIALGASMVWAARDIDYVAELLSVRSTYVGMSTRQRLSVIRQRLADHHFGANRLVTSVSAVEALARSLAEGEVEGGETGRLFEVQGPIAEVAGG